MDSPPGRRCERIRNEGEPEPQEAQKAQETYVLLVPFVVSSSLLETCGYCLKIQEEYTTLNGHPNLFRQIK